MSNFGFVRIDALLPIMLSAGQRDKLLVRTGSQQQRKNQENLAASISTSTAIPLYIISGLVYREVTVLQVRVPQVSVLGPLLSTSTASLPLGYGGKELVE